MKKRIFAMIMALLFITAVAASCTGGGVQTNAPETSPTAQPSDAVNATDDDAVDVLASNEVDEMDEIIRQAHENFTNFRNLFARDKITAFDYTVKTPTQPDGGWQGYNRTKVIIDGEYGKRSLESYSPEGEIINYDYIERNGEEIIYKDIYFENMTDFMREAMAAQVEPPFDIWADLIYQNFLTNGPMKDFSLDAVLSAEITTENGLTTTTMHVDPLGVELYRTSSRPDIGLDYDGEEPVVKSDYGDYIIITLVTGGDGYPVSCSEWCNVSMYFLGDWGNAAGGNGETPQSLLNQEQRTLFEFNAFNGDVEIVFPE